MTRKEEIKEMARTTASHITSDKDMQVAFADALRRGAEWADAHNEGLNMHIKYLKEELIDKACEWLKNDFEELTRLHLDDKVIDKFRKAMKGE